MKKDSLPKPITILVLTLLTAIVWVSLNIYRAVTVKPNTTVPENISQSLNPVLNTQVIQKIESAIFLPDSEIPQISASGTQTSAPTSTPIATPTTIIKEASPSASPQP